MARVFNKRQQEILAARAVGHDKRQSQRRKERKVAERMAIDPSYHPNFWKAQHGLNRRRKQIRRWCQALMERRDPGRPNIPDDKEAFQRLTRLKTDEELAERLKGESVSQVVKDLFARVYRERAKALKIQNGENANLDVGDWWGKGPEMMQPGAGEEAERAENAQGGQAKDGLRDEERMNVADSEAVGGFEMHLSLRMK